jgi:4-amino-4-deoxy-L-arabinose transferase-like glycosyltransferase
MLRAMAGNRSGGGAVARRFGMGIGAVAVLGLGTRAAALAATGGYRPRHDDRSYLLHALALADAHAYPVFHSGRTAVPTAYRAPGFPLLLAAAHLGLGGRLAGERVAQVLVGVAVVVLVGVLGRQLWGPRTGLAAAALAAVSPVLVTFDASLISEPLFTALLLAALACALAARARRAGPPPRRRALGWAAAAGAAVGLAALTRPEGLVLLPAVAACAGTRRAALLSGVVALACVAPWTLRNADVLHAFVPVSTETGNTLAGTYNKVSLADGRWRDPRAFHLYAAERAAHRADEAGTDRALTQAVVRFVAAHPWAPAAVALHNAPRLTGVAPTSFSRGSLVTVSLPTGPAPLLRAGLLATSALALAGAATAAARRAPPGWWAAAALVALVALLVNAEQRFAVPLQPFLLLLAPLPLTRGT